VGRLAWLGSIIAALTVAACPSETDSPADPLPPTPPGATAAGSKGPPSRDGKRGYDERLPGTPNLLAKESNPLLQDFALSPIDWSPWGEAARDKAQKLDLPLMLTLAAAGARACHGALRTLYGDPELAARLNGNQVSVMVDRVERPDVSLVFGTSLDFLSGGKLCPAHAWLTPQGLPFLGSGAPAGAQPPGDLGRLVQELARRATSEYRSDRKAVGKRAAETARWTRRLLAAGGGRRAPGTATLRDAFEHLAGQFDSEHGGFGQGAKEPPPAAIAFLLRHWRATRQQPALDMAVETLDALRNGAMHDHVGGGFHRGTEDRRWRHPRFEKTLPTNALLTLAFLEGWQATGRQAYASVVAGTLEFIDKELHVRGGGFASGLGAGRGDQPGAFYRWGPREVDEVLGGKVGRVVRAHYQIEGEGSVPAVDAPEGRQGRRPGKKAARLERTLRAARTELLKTRSRRRRPPRLDTVVASWNGLAASAFARAGLLLERSDWTERAVQAAEFVLGRMRSDGRLQRILVAGEARQPAFLEDHVHLVAALLDLFEATGRTRWLEQALELHKEQEQRFGAGDGSFWFTAPDHERLFARPKSVYDGETPAANAVAARNLLRLADLTGRQAFADRAGRLVVALSRTIESHSLRNNGLLTALEEQQATPRRIALLLPPNEKGAKELFDVIRGTFVLRGSLVRFSVGPAGTSVSRVAPWTGDLQARRGRATAFVCGTGPCGAPVKDVRALRAALAGAGKARRRTR